MAKKVSKSKNSFNNNIPNSKKNDNKKISNSKNEIKKHQGIYFKSEKGQHILTNPLIINSIIKKSNILSTDIVLEIGPGTGNLTCKLLELAKQVIVVEIDNRMVAELHKRFRDKPYYHKLKIISGDILQINIPFFNICVANIPYQISSPLIFKLLSHRPIFRCTILMLQKEFAQRLFAKPGDKMYCRLSLNTQMLSKVEHLLKISRNNFKPPPKVDSCVVRFQQKTTPIKVDYNEWDSLTRICFIRKNKTLLSSFNSKPILELLLKNYIKNNPNINQDNINIKSIISNIIQTNGFENVRSKNMSISQFLLLLKAFHEKGIYFNEISSIIPQDD